MRISRRQSANVVFGAFVRRAAGMARTGAGQRNERSQDRAQQRQNTIA